MISKRGLTTSKRGLIGIKMGVNWCDPGFSLPLKAISPSLSLERNSFLFCFSNNHLSW